MSLNSKKSWDPTRGINRAKVTKQEQDVADRKKQDEERERQAELERELAEMKAAAGGTQAPNKLAWMYEEPKPKPEKHTVPAKDDIQARDDILLGAYKLSEKAISSKQDETYEKKEELRKAAADPLTLIMAQRKAKRRGKPRRHDTSTKKAGQVMK